MQVLKTQLTAKSKGYSDVLYLDAVENKFVEEVSSCNIFMVKVRRFISLCSIFFVQNMYKQECEHYSSGSSDQFSDGVDYVRLMQYHSLAFLVELKSGWNYWLKMLPIFAGQRDLYSRVGWDNSPWYYKKEHYPISSQSWLWGIGSVAWRSGLLRELVMFWIRQYACTIMQLNNLHPPHGNWISILYCRLSIIKVAQRRKALHIFLEL